MRTNHILTAIVIVTLCAFGTAHAQTRGGHYLLAFGLGGADDPPFMNDRMEQSIEKITDAYRALRSPRFDICAETDAEVVTRDWVMETLDWYATHLSEDDTFVLYVHTHGNKLGLVAMKLRFDAIRDAILKIPAKNVIVNMMTCHSGAFIESLDAVADQWQDRASQGRNLLAFSAVNTEEVGSFSVHDEIGNPFSYAIERAITVPSWRSRPERFDCADGRCADRSAWDGRRRKSGAVSMGELAWYIPEVTKWADDHEAYYAGTIRKHPLVTGSYNPADVFVTTGRR